MPPNGIAEGVALQGPDAIHVPEDKGSAVQQLVPPRRRVGELRWAAVRRVPIWSEVYILHAANVARHVALDADVDRLALEARDEEAIGRKGIHAVERVQAFHVDDRRISAVDLNAERVLMDGALQH